jgi:hypothetical protein
MNRNIQPSGLRGRWVAITAPTSGNYIAHTAWSATVVRISFSDWWFKAP